MVETTIKHKISPCGIAQSPEVSNGVTSQERLGEVPYLTGDSKLLAERMRNRQALTKLNTVSCPIDEFVEHGISVIVESQQICARQDQRRVSRTVEIKIWHASVVG